MQNDANVFVYNGGPIPENIDKDKITHVHVNEGVTSIPNNSFKRWSSLKSIFIADGVTSIGIRAFSDCGNLISIRLPDSLETIGDCAFFDCTKLVRIRLPPNITNMGSYSFYWCLSLSNIDIPSSITSIEVNTFSRCESLSRVTIPTSVSTIRNGSFYSCHSIISIKLQSAIQHIHHHAFVLCKSLLSIQIPPSTIKIDDYAFASCSSLKVAYFPSAAIGNSERVFGLDYEDDYSYPDNLILLTDRDDFVYHDDHQRNVPSLTLRAIQQCIHNINTHATDINHDNANGDNTSTVTMTQQQRQQQSQTLHQVLHDHHPDIAQRAQQSGFNLLHLLVYFPGDILQPLTMLLDKCPLVTTAVDSTGRTPFHHTITSTQQNMDSACYDLLASRTPNKVVHLAIRSGAPWHEVYDIANAKVNGLDVADEESGLIPFMMAAIENDDEDETAEDRRCDVTLGLTAVYELLCMKPDVMNEYVDVEGGGSCIDMKTCVGGDDGAGRMMKRRRLDG